MIVILAFICKAAAISVFAIIISFFSLFFDMIIQPGMIGHFYLKFLINGFGRKQNKDYFVIEQLPEYSLRFEQHFEFALNNWFLFKPLGGCMLCANVWHSIIASIPMLIYFNFEWYWVFPVIFISSFYLRFLMNKL